MLRGSPRKILIPFYKRPKRPPLALPFRISMGGGDHVHFGGSHVRLPGYSYLYLKGNDAVPMTCNSDVFAFKIAYPARAQPAERARVTCDDGKNTLPQPVTRGIFRVIQKVSFDDERLENKRRTL
ncbi:hypothetical protein EVAR_79968_1 [Eumeta japonica]|uniref:Uncharacterized protein n=1 Tax=Eumeta variegata TaxID=151549 RepID=A0A4C1Y317_EUMVA|nr:hypothetical protein EVAR_79968_1 [Eumeta japonica]